MFFFAFQKIIPSALSEGHYLFPVVLPTQRLADHAARVVVNILAERLGVFFELLGVPENQIDGVVVVCPLTANAIVVVSAVERTHYVLGDILGHVINSPSL